MITTHARAQTPGALFFQPPGKRGVRPRMTVACRVWPRRQWIRPILTRQRAGFRQMLLIPGPRRSCRRRYFRSRRERLRLRLRGGPVDATIGPQVQGQAEEDLRYAFTWGSPTGGFERSPRENFQDLRTSPRHIGNCEETHLCQQRGTDLQTSEPYFSVIGCAGL